MIERIICCAIGYAFGCFLTADVVVRHVRGVSAFDVGLGNPGMANVGSVLGGRWALVTLAGDILKTLAAIVVCQLFLGGSLGVAASLWAGLGATLGHNFPAWHAFRGGKGVTTTCSTIILATPVAGLVASLVGAAVVVLSRYLCVGAVAIPLAYLAIALFSGNGDMIVVAVVLTALMVLAHGPAIAGIGAGTTGQTDLVGMLKKKLR